MACAAHLKDGSSISSSTEELPKTLAPSAPQTRSHQVDVLETLCHVVAEEARLGFCVCYSAVHFSSIFADHTVYFDRGKSSQRRRQEESVIETEDAERWDITGIVLFSGTVGFGEDTICSGTAGKPEICIGAGFVAPDDVEKGNHVLLLGFGFCLTSDTIKHSIDIALEVDEPGRVKDHSHLSTRD